MMRILGIDYGEKRIGLAVSDELEMLARGIATVPSRGTARNLEEIGRYVREYGVGRIVVGYPLRLDGTRGIQCEKVDAFMEALGSAFSVPIVPWDETLSTKEAEHALRQGGIGRKKRRKMVDRTAAAVILQGYLDHPGRVRHD